MSRSRKRRKFITDDGWECKFNNQAFTEIVVKKADKKTTVTALLEDLARYCIISTSTVFGWYSNYSGPPDLVMIKEVATYFNTDYHDLLMDYDSSKGRDEDLMVGIVETPDPQTNNEIVFENLKYMLIMILFSLGMSCFALVPDSPLNSVMVIGLIVVGAKIIKASPNSANTK